MKEAFLQKDLTALANLPGAQDMKQKSSLAYVPSSSLRIIQNEKPASFTNQHTLWDYIDNRENALRDNEAEHRMQLEVDQFSPEEIELLIAFFHRGFSDFTWTDSVYFKSIHDWIKAAGYSKASKRDKYYQAIEDLQKERVIFFKKREKQFAVRTNVIEIEKEKSGFYVKISEQLSHSFASKHFKRFPLAAKALLRSGGIKRVYSYHIKLLIYIADRIHNKNYNQVHLLETLLRKTGLIEYKKHCHLNRAYRHIEDTLQALVNVKALYSYTNYTDGRIKIDANFLFWQKERQKQEDSKKSKVIKLKAKTG
jgi:hypothetical protein